MSLPGGSPTPCQPGVKASGCSRLLLPGPAGMLAAFPPRDQALGLRGEHRWCPKVGFIPRALGEPVPSWAEGLLDRSAGDVFSWCASAVPNGANSFGFLDISCGFAGVAGRGKASCHLPGLSLTCAVSGLKPRED